jgi:hypothetical protein
MLALTMRTKETVEGELEDFSVGRMFVILNSVIFFSSLKQNDAFGFLTMDNFSRLTRLTFRGRPARLDRL